MRSVVCNTILIIFLSNSDLLFLTFCSGLVLPERRSDKSRFAQFQNVSVLCAKHWIKFWSDHSGRTAAIHSGNFKKM
jgi:hypothetical protein